ncbi:MAG: hypothetical protein MJZ37_04715 [Bacilli bacterium]|nr:hypothetical protein [Bacilli bacterium]
MNSLDILYRAFTEYKKTTILDADSVRFKKSNGTSGGKAKEDIVVYFSTCTIEEDWVEAIERGIPFIQKAIAEERQFIRNDGEVLPIEKIRKTSVSSIQDLAKHSNYITHEPDPNAQASVIPDKMLMIQKESDFAVYENRVIYTTLVYLRDFVSKRLNAIKEMTNKYEANAFYKRKIDFGNRKMNIDISLHEERLNDELYANRNSAKAIIDRLNDMLSNILVLLKTPLMLTVAKADMVKRPITKTNVLKMNRNFRESLTCFDFIANYQGDGFTVQRIEKSLSPFKPAILNDMSELVMLTSFITYSYGTGLEGELEKAYQEYLKQEKLNRENELLKKLKSIHAKADMDGKTLEEYLIEFEEAYRIIEKRLSEVDEVIRDLKVTHKKQMDELIKANEEAIEKMKVECNEKIDKIEEECENKIIALNDEHEKKLTETIDRYTAAINEARAESERRVSEVTEAYESRITELRDSYQAKLDETRDNYESQISSMRENYGAQISSLNEKYDTDMKEKTAFYEDKLSTTTNDLTEKYNTVKGECDETKGQNEVLTETNKAYEAEIISLKTQLKRDSVKPTEFVTRDDFVRLEEDREAFLKFFEQAWKEAKKYIKKNHFVIDKGQPKEKKEKNND